jgi:hypothetical protein
MLWDIINKKSYILCFIFFMKNPDIISWKAQYASTKIAFGRVYEDFDHNCEFPSLIIW